jgi:iron complex outermembrane receptor protein
MNSSSTVTATLQRTHSVQRTAPRTTFSVAAFALGLCCASVTLAQERNAAESAAGGGALEEVTVTAQRREESLQKTPISITAISGAELAARESTSIDTALRDVPGVVIQGNANGAGIYIRGIGSGQDSAIGGPAVNLNFDGIYQQQPEVPMASIYDVERIEVLRGPQGTLYGRNATAGSINIITANPKDSFEAAGNVAFGNYDLVHTEGMVNVPVSEKIAVRAALSSERHRGYIQPSGYDDADNVAGRVKVLMKPTDNVSFLLAGDYLHIGGVGNGGVDSLALHPKDAWYSTAPTGMTDLAAWRVYGQLDWDLGFGTLTVVPAHQDFHKFDNNVIINAPPAITSAAGKVNEVQDTVEVRLASAASSRLNWVLGLYYLDSELDLPPFVLSRISVPATTQTFPYLRGNEVSSSAAFAQLTYPVLDWLRVTGGVRYTEDEKTALDQTNAAGAITRFDGSWNSFTYKAGLEADLRPGSLLYANVSTGFKAGGIDQGFNSYEPEKLKAYAVGTKNRFFDERLQLNGEAFYYDYQDFQAQYGYRCQNAAACVPVQQFANTIVNAGAATLYGAEIETRFLMSRADLVDASVAYTHSIFDQLIITAGTANNSPLGCAATLTCALLPNQVLTNQNLANAPRWSGSFGYEHLFGFANGAGITFRADTHLFSDYWTVYRRPPQVSTESFQRSFHKSNVFLTYSAPEGKWDARLYVKNLEDEAVVTTAVGPAVTLQQPRTYGVSLSARF